MVVMKAGGRAVAIRERAWRAERAESAGGLRGKPVVILWGERDRGSGVIQMQKMFDLNPTLKHIIVVSLLLFYLSELPIA